MLLITDKTVFDQKVPIWSQPYDQIVHVDSMKVRLVSPCSKITEVREEKNPAIGKGLYFLKKWEWLHNAPEQLKDAAYQRFKQRFRKFIDWNNAMTYVPEKFGGLGFVIDEPEDFVELLGKLPPILLAAIEHCTNKNAKLEIRRSLSLFRTNTSFRGISLNDHIAGQVRAFFSGGAGNLPITVPESTVRLAAGFTEEKWRNVRWRDREKFATQYGYLSMHSAMEMVVRPSYFKEVMTGEQTLIDQLGEKETLREIRNVAYEEFVRNGQQGSFNTFLETDFSFASGYKSTVRDFNEKSWIIQKTTFERILRVSDGKEAPPVFQRSGFKTKSWDRRIDEVTEALLTYGFEGKFEVDDGYAVLNLYEQILKTNEVSFEVLFVPRSAIQGLPLLEVQVHGSGNWEEDVVRP